MLTPSLLNKVIQKGGTEVFVVCLYLYNILIYNSNQFEKVITLQLASEQSFLNNY